MKNWYYDILEELYLRYDVTGTSLNSFIKEKLKSDPKNIVTTQHIKTILKDLEKRGIITWKADEKSTNQDGVYSYHWLNIDEYKNKLGQDINGIEYTFDNIYVEAELKLGKGIDYAASIVNSKAIHDSMVETNQSVQDTNLSTRNLNDNVLPTNFESQGRGNRWSRILAGISIFFIATTVILSILDKTPQRLQDIQTELQTTRQKLEAIQLSLEKINSSMKNVTTDTILVKRK